MNANDIPLPASAKDGDADLLRRHYLNLRALNIIAALPDQGDGPLAAALEQGARHLGLDLAIISRIDGNCYTVMHHWSHEPGLENGASFELGQTYCAITLNAGDVTAIDHMGKSAHNGHPCYASFKLESYIGAPVIIDGKLFGTVNFSSARPYQRSFDDCVVEFVRLLAHWVGGVLQRLRHERELRRSNEELEAFAYAVSHDLRQPLRAVAGYMTLLERSLGDDLREDQRQFLDFARDGAKTMALKINALLDYSRVGRSADADIVPLDQALQSARANLKVLLTETGGRLDETTPLPQVRGRAVEMEHLLQNLIENALKYRSPERPPHITVAAKKQGADWRIDIADNCCGIAEDHLEHIFGLFKRLDTRGDGIGIGLALCRKIAQAHGGKLWADSSPGQGSVFHLLLPAA